jgi:hypothetical protein
MAEQSVSVAVVDKMAVSLNPKNGIGIGQSSSLKLEGVRAFELMSER